MDGTGPRSVAPPAVAASLAAPGAPKRLQLRWRLPAAGKEGLASFAGIADTLEPVLQVRSQRYESWSSLLVLQGALAVYSLFLPFMLAYTAVRATAELAGGAARLPAGAGEPAAAVAHAAAALPRLAASCVAASLRQAACLTADATRLLAMGCGAYGIYVACVAAASCLLSRLVINAGLRQLAAAAPQPYMQHVGGHIWVPVVRHPFTLASWAVYLGTSCVALGCVAAMLGVVGRPDPDAPPHDRGVVRLIASRIRKEVPALLHQAAVGGLLLVICRQLIP
ncbi:hypothetical protein ABPG75_000320 [Micractinium tetrahymenae]